MSQYPLKDIENLIDEGKITEARIIAALYGAKRFLNQK
jgi:hypothetical protein